MIHSSKMIPIIQRCFSLFIHLLCTIFSVIPLVYNRFRQFHMGNTVKTIYADQQYNSQENLSDSDEFLRASENSDSEEEMPVNNIQHDAVGIFLSSKSPFTRPEVHSQLLDQVEEHLDLYERISLIFLLYEEPNLALQEIQLLQQGAHKTTLSTWSNNERLKNFNWSDKLLEALALIQNYYVLRLLGCNKNEANERFTPNSTTNLFLNKTKKHLYQLFETLETHEVEQLHRLLKQDLKRKDFEYIKYEYLEAQFLYLITINYINWDDLSNFTKHIKILEKLDFYDLLCDEKVSSKEVSPSSSIKEYEANFSKNITTQSDLLNITTEKKVDDELDEKNSIEENASGNITSAEIARLEKILSPDTPRKNIYTDRMQNGSESSLGSRRNEESSSGNCSYTENYHLDKDKPGYLLIINQYDFSSAITKYPLKDREGTEYDVANLEKTFKSRGFSVEICNDLEYIEIESKIRNSARLAKNYSSLFVCILSHGEEDLIYGVDGRTISIKFVEKIICEHFVNKPKVLILQTCQGNSKLVAPKKELLGDEELIEADGACYNKEAEVNYKDKLVFYATIPGFAAFRDKSEGSWFIQSLCKVINEADCDFYQMCVKTNMELSGKRYKGEYMTPELKSTMTRNLVLPKKPLTTTEEILY